VSEHSFEIPAWACLMKVWFVGDSIGSPNILIDFDNLNIDIDRQLLLSQGSGTFASFTANKSLGRVSSVSKIDSLISLRSGNNRPMISQSSYFENTTAIASSWFKNSSTVFTTAQIKADNTNTINGVLNVCFL
jgi:hypothetical protein